MVASFIKQPYYKLNTTNAPKCSQQIDNVTYELMVYNWRFWIPWDCCGHWQAFGFRMTHKHTERMIKLSMRQLIPWHLMHQMKIIKPNDAITVIKSQSPHIHDSVKCGVDHIQCTHTHIHVSSNHVLTNQLIRCQSNFQLTTTNFSYQIFSAVSNSKSKSKSSKQNLSINTSEIRCHFLCVEF